VRVITSALVALIVALAIVGRVVSTARRDTLRGPPLGFEANRGQTDPRVAFLARGPRHAVFLTASETVLVLTQPDSTGLVLRMTFEDADPRPRVTGLEELPAKANYFVGNDPARWRTNVPLYAKVQYSRIYPGIDVRYSGDQSRLAYEVVVHVGADPTRITLSWQGADSLATNAQGDLVLHTAAGVLSLRKPVISQALDGRQREIDGRYVGKVANQVGFAVTASDAKRPLIIRGVVPFSISPE
jgi:hypothetical protein